MFRRTCALLVALLTASVALAAPAIAEESDGAGRGTVGDTLMELPDLPITVPLACKARVSDSAGAVHCRWRGGEDPAVDSWQLWNLQVRPEVGPRNLVAELGADTHSYVDSNVEVPAGYLYAVLGLDEEGQVVARSRVVHVRLKERSDRVEMLRLECSVHRGEGVAGDATIRDDVEIGCEWSAATDPAAEGYVLWRRVDHGEREVIARMGLDQISYVDTDVAPGHRYTYLVRAVDEEGNVVAKSHSEHVAIRAHDEPQRDQVRSHDEPERDARRAVRDGRR
jgi:hypothetical protein